MRTLFLILLCLIILAPSASARERRDNGSGGTSTAKSSSDSKDRASDSSSRSSTNSDAPSRATPRNDPPPTIVRSEPPPQPPAPRPDPPKPVEDTSRRSNSASYQPSPAPEPPKYTPPTPTVSNSAPSNSGSSSSSDNSSGRPLSRKEIKQQDRAAETSARSNPQPVYTPDSSTTSSAPAPNSGGTAPITAPSGNAYQPNTTSQPVNIAPNTTGPSSGTVSGPESKSTTVNGPGEGSRVTGSTSSTANYSPKKQVKLDQKAKDAQTKTQRDGVNRAYKPGGTPGYTPGEQTDTGRPPVVSGKRVGKTTNGPGYRPADRPIATGYAPRGTVYKVGYRPGKLTRPHGYTPPIIRDGRWRYPQTHFPRPCFFGHWAYEYYPGFSWRSAFFYFGIYPYVEVTRIQEYPREDIEFVSEPLYISGSNYAYDSRWDRIDEALADIRSTWLAGRFDLLKQHVRPESTIAVMTDGQYDYAISSEDYLSMTEDALDELDTVSFIWNKVRERRDGTVMAFADHSYWSNDRARTVYVSYTFKKVGGDYFISEIGSSANPLNDL